MTNQDDNYIPTLAEYIDQFRRPNYFDDIRTPEEMKQTWRKQIIDKYYELYGDKRISDLRLLVRKEGE